MSLSGEKKTHMNPREFVKEYSIRSLVCCFSGGKDSLAATHYTLTELKEVEIEKYVAFVDTTVMVPGTIDFVKDLCSKLGWNLKILSPQIDFWSLASKWGVPTMRRRWCCYALKLKPIFDFVREQIPQRGVIVGLRQKESKRREKKKYKEVWRNKRNNSWQFCPILNWNEKDVWRYLQEHDLPKPPHYKLGIKETCMCGAFATKKELEILRGRFPEFFQKFVELEEGFKSSGSAFFLQNKRVYAKDLLKQKTLEVER